jgi:hypothetical protein
VTAARIACWDDAVAAALALAGTELSTSYGQPAVKCAANGRAFLNVGHEPDTSFVVQIDRDTVEILKETDPDTFWQTAHYEGWPAVLVRYRSADPERVRDVIARAQEQAAARKPARPRRK